MGVRARGPTDRRGALTPAGAGPTGPDEDLELQLELELPSPLFVGRGSAVFVYGSCFHRRSTVRAQSILVEGRPVAPIAQRMPRRDLLDAARGRDPLGHAYRSAFWGIVPLPPVEESRRAELEVRAELDDGSVARGHLATLELEPSAPRRPVTWSGERGADGPPVAICMATFDPPIELFRRQIDSIRAQTHANWMCVIADDASSDHHLAEMERVLDDDPRFVISPSAERLGFYSNFERALSLAPREAEYVALADQDDRWEPDKLKTLISRLGDAGLAYSDARVIDADGGLISDTYWSRRRTNHSNLASLLISNTITGAASLFRRELLGRILPFPPPLGTQWHDHWIALVALASGPVAYVDRPLYDYVQHREAVVGHAVANPTSTRRSLAERTRLVREDWRGAFGGWCWKYFYGVCRMVMVARILELRCGGSLRGRKRRELRRFLSIDSSPLGYPWLSVRRLRRLAGRNETLGGELVFLHGIAWRRLLAIANLGRSSAPRWLPKDATLPAPGGPDVVAAGKGSDPAD